MNIYIENDYDIIYNINADYSNQLVNYPIYLSQYSSDIYIRVNLFDNYRPVKTDYFSSITLTWYNYSVKKTFSLQSDFISEFGSSVYFKISSNKTELYNKWAPTKIKINLTRGDETSITEVDLIVERNPIQK